MYINTPIFIYIYISPAPPPHRLIFPLAFRSRPPLSRTPSPQNSNTGRGVKRIRIRTCIAAVMYGDGGESLG